MKTCPYRETHCEDNKSCGKGRYKDMNFKHCVFYKIVTRTLNSSTLKEKVGIRNIKMGKGKMIIKNNTVYYLGTAPYKDADIPVLTYEVVILKKEDWNKVKSKLEVKIDE